MKRLGLATVGAVLVGAMLFTALTVYGRQERPARPTRQWEAAGIVYRDWTSARVDVIDTEGVCLYVVVRGNVDVALAAIAKTQLPKGAGCQ